MKICETVEDCKNKRSISDQHKMKTILPGVTSSIPNVNLEAIKFLDIAFWERKKKKRKREKERGKENSQRSEVQIFGSKIGGVKCQVISGRRARKRIPGIW
mgnify:CR=1 FL=1